MNNSALCIKLWDNEKSESDVLRRPIVPYWIGNLITESDGMRISRLVAIGLTKKCHRIKKLLDSGDLVFVPYKTIRLYNSALHCTEREIESISVEDNKFVIKFKKS